MSTGKRSLGKETHNAGVDEEHPGYFRFSGEEPEGSGSQRIHYHGSAAERTAEQAALVPLSHDELVQRAGRWLRHRRRCGVVLLEPGYGSPSEVPDAIGWTSGTHSVLVECKVSRREFLADTEKPARRRERADALAGIEGSGDGPGGERWYLAPAGILAPSELPDGWGLLEVREGRVYRVREAERRERSVASLRRELVTLVGMARAVQLQAEGVRLSPSRHGEANLGGQREGALPERRPETDAGSEAPS